MVESFVIPVLVAFGLVVASFLTCSVDDMGNMPWSRSFLSFAVCGVWRNYARGRSDCRCLVPIFLCVGADSF